MKVKIKKGARIYDYDWYDATGELKLYMIANHDFTGKACDYDDKLCCYLFDNWISDDMRLDTITVCVNKDYCEGLE